MEKIICRCRWCGMYLGWEKRADDDKRDVIPGICYSCFEQKEDKMEILDLEGGD